MQQLSTELVVGYRLVGADLLRFRILKSYFVPFGRALLIQLASNIYIS